MRFWFYADLFLAQKKTHQARTRCTEIGQDIEKYTRIVKNTFLCSDTSFGSVSPTLTTDLTTGENKSGKEQNEQQSETLPYNSESG